MVFVVSDTQDLFSPTGVFALDGNDNLWLLEYDNLTYLWLSPSERDEIARREGEVPRTVEDAVTTPVRFGEGETLAALRERYDGYCFHPEGPKGKGAERVYNPYSLMRALDAARIGSYWFGTGTPTFLVRRIRDAGLDARRMEEGEVFADESYLMNYRAENPDPVPLLFKTGYLTIRGYDEDYGEYALGIPNREVREGLLEGLLCEYTGGASALSGTRVGDLRRRLDAGDADGVRDILAALFAGIPYTTAADGRDPFENHFQAVLYVTFLLLGLYVAVETRVAHGRVDVIVECRRHVWVMELKRDGTAADALAQIEDQGYALRYAADPRVLHRVGCSFDTKTRLLAEWEAV
jgi:hypothetical protein